MILKAQISEIVDKNHVKVRIPMLNLSAEDSNGTPNSELPVAEICTLPSCFLNPRLGDVVWVAFENGEEGKPVVIGYMQGEYNTETTVDLTVGTLTINGQVKLPATTTIGSVTSESIQSLYGVSENLQDQVNSLTSIVSQLTSPILIILDKDDNFLDYAVYDETYGSIDDYSYYTIPNDVEKHPIYNNITLSYGDWVIYSLQTGIISGQVKSYTTTFPDKNEKLSPPQIKISVKLSDIIPDEPQPLPGDVAHLHLVFALNTNASSVFMNNLQVWYEYDSQTVLTGISENPEVVPDPEQHFAEDVAFGNIRYIKVFDPFSETGDEVNYRLCFSIDIDCKSIDTTPPPEGEEPPTQSAEWRDGYITIFITWKIGDGLIYNPNSPI